MLIASRLTIPPLTSAEQNAVGRPLHQIARQPAFVVAVLAAACGYGVMSLLMTATPLAMDICGLPFADTAFILQWHVIGMFAPSFFTGGLIKRFGVLNILITGDGWASLHVYAIPVVAMTTLASALFWLYRRSARNRETSAAG